MKKYTTQYLLTFLLLSQAAFFELRILEATVFENGGFHECTI